MTADPFVPPAISELDLLSYRRVTAELYREVRQRGASEDTWRWWTASRDEIFATHPASPFVASERPFDGLAYHPYDGAFHLGEITVNSADPFTSLIDHSGSGTTSATRFGTVELVVGETRHALSVFWLDVYGGGVFLPMRDRSNGASTYGGGRYLLDTVKGADLGGSGARLVIDLNFAYHPSCVHDPRWSCPLAPIDERLPVPVAAGERLPPPVSAAGSPDG